MPTPHIESKKEDIAKVVLMPGDPLRAKMIAEKYLDNPRLVNSVRNILAYTGTYKGKEVDKSYSNSAYDDILNGENVPYSEGSIELNNKILECADARGDQILFGNIYCTDVFYSELENPTRLYNDHKCLGVEMESFALFLNAKKLNKKAACILTVSDNLITGAEATSEERQNSFTKMITLALDSIL